MNLYRPEYASRMKSSPSSSSSSSSLHPPHCPPVRAEPKWWEEAIGWYGSVVILLAYALVSFGVTQADSAWALFFNVSGSLGLGYISLRERSWQAGVLNIIWFIIGLIGIVRGVIG